jgi:hypothetical protein
MKKFLVLCLAVFFAAGVGFTQSAGCAPDKTAQNNTQETKITGKFAWVNGRVVVLANGKTYYTRGLNKLANFVPAVKEDAEVTLTGYVMPPQPGRRVGEKTDPNAVYFMARTVTVAGKDYDMGTPPLPGRPDQFSRRPERTH